MLITVVVLLVFDGVVLFFAFVISLGCAYFSVSPTDLVCSVSFFIRLLMSCNVFPSSTMVISFVGCVSLDSLIF